MTFRGLLLRFSIAYVLSLVFGTWLAVLFANQSAMIITTAALAASTLYVCQLYSRRNGRRMGAREMALAWGAFLAIDLVLQALAVLSLVGPLDENLLRLRQFAAGALAFTAVFHGVCIYAFIWMAGTIYARKNRA